jgi:hydroxypyruvate isomerase
MLNFSANISLLFSELVFEDRFEAAHKAGFKAIEIQFPYDFSPAHLKQLIDEYQLKLVLINVPAGDLMQGGDGIACIPGQESAFAAAVEKALDYAVPLNVPTINILAGRNPNNITRDTCLEIFENNVHHAAQQLQKHQITPVIEAINTFDIPRFLIHSLNDMLKICQKIPSVKMQFDIYHMSLMRENISLAICDLLPYIGHIQFADAPGRHEPGTGHIDLASLFTLIQKSHYVGWCGAEYRPTKLTCDTLAWLSNWQTSP